MILRACVCALLAALSTTARAQLAQLDETFGTVGSLRYDAGSDNDRSRRLVSDSLGRMYILGYQFDGDQGSPTNVRDVIVRMAPNGAIDDAFGTDGKIILLRATLGMTPYALHVDEANQFVYLGGAHDGLANGNATRFAVARVSFAGALDTAYGDGGLATIEPPASSEASPYTNEVGSMALQEDGQLVAAGVRQYLDESSKIAMARFTTAGDADPNFGGDSADGGFLVLDFGQSDEYAQVTSLEGGRLLLTGGSGPSGNPQLLVARLTSGGALDPEFGGTGYLLDFDHVLAVLPPRIEDDGAVTVVGAVNEPNTPPTNYVVRYTASGARDATFADNGLLLRADSNYLVPDAALLPSGKVAWTYALASSADPDNHDFIIVRMLGLTAEPDYFPPSDGGAGGGGGAYDITLLAFLALASAVRRKRSPIAASS